MKKKIYITKKKFNKNIVYGFFTKNYGYSKGIYNSLNCSLTSGDKKNIVKKNIKLALEKLNLDKKKLKLINQTHSNKIILVNRKNLKEEIKGDGLIAKDTNICLAILTADCCPIFLYDVDSSFISCVHAGWRGAYLNIIKNALKKINKIQPNKNKIHAVIGPCLDKNYFEVDKDFEQMFLKKNVSYKKFFSIYKNNSKSLFNLRELIKFQLNNCDIYNVQECKFDTYSNKKLFFSHRRSRHKNQVDTGRMINIIGYI